MANWVTMSALGFVMETMSLILGPFFPFFLVFWVIINVSPVFLDLGDMAYFYSYALVIVNDGYGRADVQVDLHCRFGIWWILRNL